ncbi:MAG: copper homeostasis protein CutC [Bacteroidales bacterium]|jgi:copper homeostasis protein|nr:copper homeostasis protein CutC [Bacteroidales bacterium]
MERKICFEVCANSVESCVAAQNGGADRVELCSALEVDGLTPSYATIKEARKILNIKLHVLIRPRSGNFCYSKNEIDKMAEEIRMAVSLGADGVVFGCLTHDGDIDIEAVKYLISVARESKNVPITFHRAFDVCGNPHKALEQLIDLKIDRLLTSGHQQTAEIGIPLLADLQSIASSRKAAAHERNESVGIKIMAGCGVNENNIAKIYRQTQIAEYHFSAKIKKQSGLGEYYVTSEEKVKETINALREL